MVSDLNQWSLQYLRFRKYSVVGKGGVEKKDGIE